MPGLRRALGRTMKWLRRPVLLGGGIAAALLFMLANNLFKTFQLSLTNIYYVDSPVSGAVTLVALDNASFAQFGRTPGLWDRAVYAQLTERLAQAGARVIVFDLLFSEPSASDEVLAQALQAARQGAARARIVLAAAGADIPQAATLENYRRGLRYNAVLWPVETLAQQADYVGFVNVFPDADSRVRRQPSIVQADEVDAAQISLSLAAYLAWLRIPAAALEQVVVEQGDTLTVTPARALATDEFGLWRQNFFTSAARRQPAGFEIVSLLDVLEGRADPALFADRIVMIGILNSTGATDEAIVPNSDLPMAGVEVQANAVESLLQNRPLTEQTHAQQAAAVALLALGSTVGYSLLTWRWRVPLLLALLAGYFMLCFVQFESAGFVNALFYPTLALVLPFVASLSMSIAEEAALRIRSEAQVSLLQHLNQRAADEKALLEALHQKTQAERETLRQLNELKTRMIRIASHDLKNPLGRVFGYSELLLLDDSLNAEARGFVRHIRLAGDEMNALITEILDLEQLRSGTLNRERLSFSLLVRQVVTRHEPDFYRNHQLYHEHITDDPLMMNVDARQISQAVSNLVSNATKYTPQGGRISVRVYERAGCARFEVKDTGYGIPADAMSQLFTEFFRARTQATQMIKGTGLGLSLVRQIAESHEGRVWAESVEGEGSTFYLELPLEAEARPEAASA